MIGPIAPGAQFFTSVNYGVTPVQPGVRLLAADGTTTTSRSTSGIVNMGGYTRGKLLTAPATVGWYLPEWDDSDGTPRYPDEAVWVSTIYTDILSAAVAGGSSGISAAPLVLPAGGVSPVVSQTFFIKRGDTEPLIFPITELDSTGHPQLLDVTGWTGNFKLRATPDSGTAIINAAFYISDTDGIVTTDGSGGLLAFAWPTTGQTDREGLFYAEFECHRSDGFKKTYPTTSDLTNEYIKVYFVPDLDDAGSH